MIIRRTVLLLVLMAFFVLPNQASAHFQLVYTDAVVLEKPTTMEMRLVFGHPLENSHVMKMEKPLEFYYVHKGKKVNLLSSLQSIMWQGPSNKAAAYETQVKAKRNGDYIFVVVPAPYYEKSEDIYIQQITKSFVNRGGFPSGWNEPLGLKTEIVPLNKPTNVFVGSTFSGVVLSNGKPVAEAELEIEWINGSPDLNKNRFGASRVDPPSTSIVAITDVNGVFTFGIPRAGDWGFAALGVGPDKTHNGKELSQDAVIWIRASDLK